VTSDPDDLLRRLRHAIGQEQAAGDGSYAAEITALFAELDAWLSQHGRLPAAWTP
jgi:hypothetical protein